MIDEVKNFLKQKNNGQCFCGDEKESLISLCNCKEKLQSVHLQCLAEYIQVMQETQGSKFSMPNFINSKEKEPEENNKEYF